MADIDQIIAGGAGAGTTADFSGIPKMLDYFYKSKDEAAKNDLRDAFKGGLPMKDGQVDWPTVTQKFFSVGAVDQGMAAANQSLAQQNMQFGQGQSAAIQNFDRGGQPQSQTAVTNVPSLNRTVQGKVAPELNKGGVPAQGEGGVTPKKYLANLGLQPGYNMEVGLAAFKRNGIEPDDPFDPNDPNLAKVMPDMQRMGSIGQVQPPQPGDGQPMQAPQAPMQPQVPQGRPAPVTNALTTTQPSAEPSRAEKGIAFFSAIMADPRTSKPNMELAKSRLEALQKSNELTPDQKNYVQYKLEGGKGTMQEYQVALEGQKSQAIEQAKLTGPQREYAQARQQGFKGTLEDWQNRTDDNTTNRVILDKSLLPKIDASQEKATASRDDIDAIHRARNELDQKGGVFSGAAAEKKLYLAKAAELLGIPDADKIQNTEAYGAAIGQRVAVMVKAFGSGTAISDGDRRFAAAMAGGQVTLEEGSMRRILDIAEKANRGKIDQHNQLVDKVVSANEGLKSARDSYIVKAPGEYKKTDVSASFPKFNSPADLHAAIASKKLKSGDAFLTSDGRTKYVP